MSTLLLRQFAPVLALVAMTACDSSTSVSMQLTARAADEPDQVQRIDSAVVTIERVYLQGMLGEQADPELRVTLRDEPYTVDLRNLSTHTAKLLEDVPVEPGVYSQLRFVISGAYISVTDKRGAQRVYSTPAYDQVPPGTEIDGILRTPSWSTSGFKVKAPKGGFDFSDGRVTLEVDFDVGDSFGQPTGTDAWVFRPVLRATRVIELEPRPMAPDPIPATP